MTIVEKVLFLFKRRPKRPEAGRPCFGCRLPLDPFSAIAFRGHSYHRDTACLFAPPTVLRGPITRAEAERIAPMVAKGGVWPS